MSFLTKTAVLALAASLASAMPVEKRASGKGGVAYNDASYTNYFDGGNMVWAYNWNSKDDNSNRKLEFAPMLHDLKEDWRGPNFQTDAAAAIAAGSTALLGFNEPDVSAQADMTVEDAVAGWKKWMEPFKSSNPDVKLISPAVSNGPAPMGLDWLKRFIDQCDGCHIDGIALHWYDSYNNFAYFQNYLQGASQEFNKPIWLTEFGTNDGSAQDKANFLQQQAIPFLEQSDFIERYAWFMAAEDNLVNSDGSGLSSPLGTTYNSQ